MRVNRVCWLQGVLHNYRQVAVSPCFSLLVELLAC